MDTGIVTVQDTDQDTVVVTVQDTAVVTVQDTAVVTEVGTAVVTVADTVTFQSQLLAVLAVKAESAEVWVPYCPCSSFSSSSLRCSVTRADAATTSFSSTAHSPVKVSNIHSRKQRYFSCATFLTVIYFPALYINGITST